MNIWALNSASSGTTLECIAGPRILPALLSLGMHSCNIEDYSEPWTAARDFSMRWIERLSAPALRKLVCTDQHLANIPPGLAITSLELHRLPPGMTTPTGLKYVFTKLPHLSTLVVGRLSCEARYGGYFLLPQEQPLLVPALKHFAIASPVFNKRSDVFGRGCLPNCSCVIRNLVAENLEYIEVTGARGEALFHLEQLITHRIQQSTRPITLFLNGCKFRSFDDNSYTLPRYIIDSAPSIDLQFNPETAWSVENAKWNPEMVAFRSCVLHFSGDILLPPSLQVLSRIPVVDNRVPALLYPARHDFQVNFNFRPQFLDPQTMEEKFRDPEYDIDETEYTYFYARGSDYGREDGPSDDEIIDQALDMETFAKRAVDVEHEMVDHYRLWKMCDPDEEIVKDY